MENRQIERATFTASEAEKITGVSGTDQRNFRRSGYTPASKGWTRFSLDETARLLIIESCRRSHVPPAAGSVVASTRRATDYLLAFASEFDGAIEGAALLPPGQVPLRMPRGELRRFLVVFGEGEGDYRFVTDLKKLYFSRDEIGAFIVVDLKALAGRLVDGAGRPLVTIKTRERGVA